MGGFPLTELKERVLMLANYIVEHKATVRMAAKEYGISKSTVHKDMTTRLRYYNGNLYEQVRAILDINKAERHLRGGMATKKKYRPDT